VLSVLCGLACASPPAMAQYAISAAMPDGAPAGQHHDPAYKGPAPHELGGPFTLVDHEGREVSPETWKGRYLLMFFGFVGCRESCPTGLTNMQGALELMGKEGERIQPLFVDIDMIRPDQSALAEFVANFHPRLVGLTGSRKQIFAVCRDFRVRRDFQHNYFSKKETGARINHSTYFFLVAPDGRTLTYFYHNLPPERMVAELRRHMQP
jgi:protein SCO1/2